MKCGECFVVIYLGLLSFLLIVILLEVCKVMYFLIWFVVIGGNLVFLFWVNVDLIEVIVVSQMNEVNYVNEFRLNEFSLNDFNQVLNR